MESCQFWICTPTSTLHLLELQMLNMLLHQHDLIRAYSSRRKPRRLTLQSSLLHSWSQYHRHLLVLYAFFFLLCFILWFFCLFLFVGGFFVFCLFVFCFLVSFYLVAKCYKWSYFFPRKRAYSMSHFSFVIKKISCGSF